MAEDAPILLKLNINEAIPLRLHMLAQSAHHVTVTGKKDSLYMVNYNGEVEIIPVISASITGKREALTITDNNGIVSSGGNIVITGTREAIVLTDYLGSVQSSVNQLINGQVANVTLTDLSGNISAIRNISISGAKEGISLADNHGMVQIGGNQTIQGRAQSLTITDHAGQVSGISNTIISGAKDTITLNQQAGNVVTNSNADITGESEQLTFIQNAGTITPVSNVSVSGQYEEVFLIGINGSAITNTSIQGADESITLTDSTGTVTTNANTVINGVNKSLILSEKAGVINTTGNVSITGVNNIITISDHAGVAFIEPMTSASIQPAFWVDMNNPASYTESAGIIESLIDLSGNQPAVNQTTTVKPSLNTTELGVPALDFTGADKHIYNSSPFMYASGAVTIIAVLKAANTSEEDRRILAEGRSANDSPVYAPFQSGKLSGSDSITAYIRNDAGSPRLAQPDLGDNALDGTLSIASSVDTGDVFSAAKNTNALSSASYTRDGTLTLDRFSIGSTLRTSASSFWNGYILEIGIFPVAMPETERLSIITALMQKWGIGQQPVYLMEEPFAGSTIDPTVLSVNNPNASITFQQNDGLIASADGATYVGSAFDNRANSVESFAGDIEITYKMQVTTFDTVIHYHGIWIDSNNYFAWTRNTNGAGDQDTIRILSMSGGVDARQDFPEVYGNYTHFRISIIGTEVKFMASADGGYFFQLGTTFTNGVAGNKSFFVSTANHIYGARVMKFNDLTIAEAIEEVVEPDEPPVGTGMAIYPVGPTEGLTPVTQHAIGNIVSFPVADYVVLEHDMTIGDAPSGVIFHYGTMAIGFLGEYLVIRTGNMSKTKGDRDKDANFMFLKWEVLKNKPRTFTYTFYKGDAVEDSRIEVMVDKIKVSTMMNGYIPDIFLPAQGGYSVINGTIGAGVDNTALAGVTLHTDMFHYNEKPNYNE